jgi:hypothetical protein
MKRTLSTAIITALAALTFAAGCSKKKAEDGKDSAAAALGDVAVPGAEATYSAHTLAVFPADSEWLMSFSLEGLRKSPLWAKVAPLVQAKLDAEMSKVKETCGIDPLAKLGSVVVAGKASDEKSVVVVLKGFTKAELTGCIGPMAKKDGKDVEVSEEDGFVKIHNKSDASEKDIYLKWLDPTTVLITPNGDKAWFSARAAGTAGLDGNVAFAALLKNVNTSATIYMVGLPAAGSEMDLSKNVAGAQGFFASINVTDGLGIDGGLRFDTEANAKSALAMATQAMQQGKAMVPPAVGSVVDKTKLTTTASDVRLQLQLTTADISAIGEALGPMLAPMLGGLAK